MKIHTFMVPKKILFGINAVDNVGLEASLFGSKALVISDSNIEKAGLLSRVRKRLEKSNIEVHVFDEGGVEPTLEIARSVAKLVREKKHNLVVGVGGGSVMDMAKVASAAVTNTKDVAEYLGVNKIERSGIPMILIPTTAGTASEVTANSIVVIPEENLKAAIVSPYLLADVAIVDPTMTLTAPPGITASTGIDALSHAIEAVMSTGASHITDTLALESVRLIGQNLREAYAQGSNLEARYNMALGSLLAGMAFNNAGVCIGHAVAYTFSAKHSISHGMSCGLSLPYVMDFNLIACMLKLAKVSVALTGKTYSSLRESALDAASAVKELMEDVSLPTSLKEVGVAREEIPELADSLLRNERLLARNPRTITRKQAVELYERMWEGRLKRT
jgi:alcohol dehydrogenase class IV